MGAKVRRRRLKEGEGSKNRGHEEDEVGCPTDMHYKNT
jgi:hypothetical protein